MQNSGVVRQLQQIEAQVTQEHSRSLSLQAIQKLPDSMLSAFAAAKWLSATA